MDTCIHGVARPYCCVCYQPAEPHVQVPASQPDPKDAEYKLPPQGFVRNLQNTIDQLRPRVQELERERDEARAECETLKKNLADAQSDCAAEVEACRRLEAQAALLREALHCACNAIQNGQPELAAKDLDDALAETDAGALGLKLVEALRKCRDRIEADDCWRADNGEVQHNDLCVIATDALDAWDAGGRGRDGPDHD